MNNNEKKALSTFQIVLMVVTVVLFIAFIWRMIPFNNLTKATFCLFPCLGIFSLVFTFVDVLFNFKKIKSSQTAIAVTMVLFLVIPLFINIIYDVNKKEYLESYPNDDIISAKITCDVERVGGSGSIGNEWSYRYFLNDELFENGEICTFDITQYPTITSRIIEHDDSISDVGEKQSTISYTSNDIHKREITVSHFVHVVEHGGKRYAGSSADFRVLYKLERVIPASMNFWDVLFWTSNDSKNALCVLLIIGQAVCLLVVIFVIIIGKKKEKQEEESARQRKENEFLEGKASFIETLRGKSIRQAAGVPEYVSFVNNLPKDNNDATYGSFTVYCSSRGTRYHQKRGCSSASVPFHYIKAKKLYSPCSKCCVRNITIPQWYYRYEELKKQAEVYGIDVVK